MKRWFKKIVKSRQYINIVLSLLFVVGTISPLLVVKIARATTYIIAAADSSAYWKGLATAVCDNTSDQDTIAAYLGNTIQLAPGTYQFDGWLYPATNTTITGQGDTTIINLSNNSSIEAINNSNIELGNFKITGQAYPSGALLIAATSSNVTDFYIHDVSIYSTNGHDFAVYAAENCTISNVSFVRDYASNPDGMGFIVAGEGANPTIENITFVYCSSVNAGVAATRFNDDVTGFDLAEYNGLTVDHLQALACSSNGSWESGFHIEELPTKTNIVIADSSASYAGLDSPADFGAGYLMANHAGDDFILNNNSGSNNAIADLRVWNAGNSTYTNYTPAIDLVFPTSSIKVVSRISTGNAIGLKITNNTTAELALYSSNNNSVSQTVSLGAVYSVASVRGGTATENGTSLDVSYNDYLIVELNEGAPLAPTNVSATDGLSTNNVTITWTKSAGATNYTIWRDSTNLTSVGDVATYTDNTADSPTITAGIADASDGTSNATVALTLAGASANNGTSYTYKVQAHSAVGSSANSTGNTGYCGVGVLTYQWMRSSGDSDAGYSDIIGGTTNPYYDTGGVVTPDGRYYKAALSATGATSVNSTADRGYMGLTAGSPTISIQAASSVGYSTATLNGNLNDSGGEDCTITVYWGTTDGGTTPSNWSNNSSPTSPSQPQSSGTLYYNAAGLNENTTYYFSAKATNSANTSWPASSLSFTTTFSPPVTPATTGTTVARAIFPLLIIALPIFFGLKVVSQGQVTIGNIMVGLILLMIAIFLSVSLLPAIQELLNGL